MAGTALAAMAAESHVACVTATDGEAGMTADETRWPRAGLAGIRRRELAASLAVLGLADHTWLGPPDGGLDALDAALGVGLVAETVERAVTYRAWVANEYWVWRG